MKENDRILFVSTADTDTLSAVESLKTISSKIPKVEIINIHSGWESRENQQQLFDAVLASRVVVLRLLGGKQAIPESFDHIVQICNEQNVQISTILDLKNRKFVNRNCKIRNITLS